MKSERLWIYKWDEHVPGVFYSLDEGGHVRIGKVNLKVETGAANWILIFFKSRLETTKFPDYLRVTAVVVDEDDHHEQEQESMQSCWWYTPEEGSAEDFAAGKHLCQAAYVYFDSLHIAKYAYFFERNKKAFGIEGVAAIKTGLQEAILSQYFLQCVKRNGDFSPYGSFVVSVDENSCDALPSLLNVKRPFDDLAFQSSDHRFRPDISVAAYDIEVANVTGSACFPNGLCSDEKIVGVSCSSAVVDRNTGKRRGSYDTLLWLWLPNTPGATSVDFGAEFSQDDLVTLRVFHDEAELLTDFFAHLAKFPFTVGYNSTRFDNNVLLAKILQFGLGIPGVPIEIDVWKHFLKYWMQNDHYKDSSLCQPHQEHFDMLKYYGENAPSKPVESLRLDSVSRALLGRGKEEDLDVVQIHCRYAKMCSEGKLDVRYLRQLLRYMATDAALPLELFLQDHVLDFASVLSSKTFLNLGSVLGSSSLRVNNYLFYRMTFPERKPRTCERLFKVMGSRFRASNVVVDDDVGVKKKKKKKTAQYDGGLVVKPVPGIYEWVYVLDFASLYPSVIIRHNISPGFVYTATTSEYDIKHDFYHEHFHVLPSDDGTKVFLTPLQKNSSGANPPLANVERQLVQAREYYKPLRKESAYYASLETALKLMANTMYGLLGMSNVTITSDKKAAEAVTAYGRHYWRLLAKFTSANPPMYGDTDSIFICNKGWRSDSKHPEGVVPGRKFAVDFQAFLGNPLPRLEYENEFVKLIIISKKKYVGTLSSGDIKSVGFIKKVPSLMAALVNGIIAKTLDGNTSSTDVLAWAEKHILRIHAKIDCPAAFVQTMKLKDDLYAYSSKTHAPHVVFARRLHDAGLDLRVLGGQLHYVPVIKDIQGTWAGNSFELVEHTKGMTVDLEVFASSYLSNINSLLKVAYKLPTDTLSKFVSKISAESRCLRLGWLLRQEPDVTLWTKDGSHSLQSQPNLRPILKDWNSFATIYRIFPDSVANTTIPVLATLTIPVVWLPRRGFAYSDVPDCVSEFSNMACLEKFLHEVYDTAGIPFVLLLSCEDPQWNLHDMLREVLGCRPVAAQEGINPSNDGRFHVTPFGVFDKETRFAYDCLEKALVAAGGP